MESGKLYAAVTNIKDTNSNEIEVSKHDEFAMPSAKVGGCIQIASSGEKVKITVVGNLTIMLEHPVKSMNCNYLKAGEVLIIINETTNDTTK